MINDYKDYLGGNLLEFRGEIAQLGVVLVDEQNICGQGLCNISWILVVLLFK